MSPFERQDELLRGLRLGNNEAFEHLYRRHYHSTAAFVRQNSGSETDARDVFQETLMVLLRKIRLDDFDLHGELGAYLYAISRKIWLYRLRSQKTDLKKHNEAPLPLPEDPDFEHSFEEKHQVVKKLLETLKDDCRKVLEGFYFLRQTLPELAASMGWAEGYAKLKKHRCMEALREKTLKSFNEMGF